MKEHVKVALVQFAPEWLQPVKNADRMAEFTKEEAENRAELIVFPECANLGYITPLYPGDATSFDTETSAAEFRIKYARNSEPIPGPTTDALGEVAKKYGVYIVVGIAEMHQTINGGLYDSAALIGPSGILGVHRKVHLAANEKTFFVPGSTAEAYNTDLGKIGLLVCYDGFFPELPRVLGLKGAEIVCLILAAPTRSAFIGADIFRQRASHRAAENANYYVCCNRTGTEGKFHFFGHSAIGGPDGSILGYSESDKEEVLTAMLSNEEILKARASLNVYYDRRPDMYSSIVEPLS